MNKLFTKIAALFLGMTMAVGVGVAVGTSSKASQVRAAEEAVVFSEQGYSNGEEVTSYSGANFSISFDAGSKYYDTGAALRVYAGKSFTVSSTNTMTSIALSFGSGDKTNTITTNVNTYSNGTWTGSANSVAFSVGGTKEHRRIAGVTVTYDGGSTPTTKYDVKFYDGTTEYTDLKQSVEEGGYATRPSPNPSKDGYSFDNWYTDDSFDTLFDFENTVINEPTNIYAKFNALVASNYRVTTLTAGKQVLIVTKDSEGTYYMLPAATTESSPSNATRPTVTNGIISGVYDNNLFTVASSDSNWTFANSSGTNYLVITGNDSTNVRINTNANKVWTYNSTDKTLKNTATNRYLGAYTSGKDWRSYASSSQAGYNGTGENIQFFEKFEGKITLDSPVPVYNDASKEISWDPIPGATSYELKIDSGSYSTQTSPYSVSALQVGTHTVSIIAKGNTSMYEDSEPGVLEFTITAPTTIDHVDITTKPTSPVTDKTVGNTFTFGATATRATGSGESTFTWASTDTSVATIDAATGVLTYVGNGTTTISAQSNYPAATGKTNVGTFVLEVENLKGSALNPLTVEEGRDIAQPATEETTLQYYTTGIIFAVQSDDYDANKGYKTIWITSDGVDDESRELQAYHAYYLNNQKMTEEQFNSIEDGDTVVIFGKFKNYNSGTLEITSCYIYSHEKPAASTYTVTYNSNGGTGEMIDENSPYDAGSEVTVLANTFTKAGYTFNHWNTASNDSGTSYNADDTFTINANTTLYAQWTEVIEPGDWVLTDLADLTSEDVFVIVGDNGNTYAMSNDNGTSNPPDAIEVTISGDKITSSVTNKIKWTISGNATDGYTFYPNGSTETWLYCTNNNNGLRVGDSSNNTFEIKDNYLYNKGQGRYIGVYNSQDWRSYTSINNNIKDQTFAFYKFVSETPTPVITIHTQTNDSYYVDDCIEDFVTIENGNISDVTFTSTNDEVAEVADGILYVYAEGDTTITASYSGAETKTATIHAYNLLVSGAVDNVRGDFFVKDRGTLVVKAPEGYDKFLGATNEDGQQTKFLAAGVGSTYDPTTKTVTCSFEVSATSEIENLSVQFYFGINEQAGQKVITKTLHIINPTGLDAARAFAGSINACCGSGSDMSDLWEMLADDWADLSEAAKSFLINAHYDVTGTGEQTVVTKHDDTHYELAEAMSRYDFMVEHYGMTNFMNKTGLTTGGRVVINPFASMGENSNMVAIVVIVSVVSLTAIGGYFFLKKRREQN